MPVRVLLTGFEPFPPHPDNPSGDAQAVLDGTTVTALAGSSGARDGLVHGALLHVVWQTAAPELRAAITRWHPHIAISLGMAAGSVFRVESVARDVNLPIRDNRRRLPERRHDHPNDPHMLATTLPIPAIEAAITAAGGTPASSSDAGGFLCEDVFYELMLFYTQHGARTNLFRAGFIHLPYTPGAYDTAARTIVNNAVRGAIEATIADLTAAEYTTALTSP